jgi:hypothetical protein
MNGTSFEGSRTKLQMQEAVKDCYDQVSEYKKREAQQAKRDAERDRIIAERESFGSLRNAPTQNDSKTDGSKSDSQPEGNRGSTQAGNRPPPIRRSPSGASRLGQSSPAEAQVGDSSMDDANRAEQAAARKAEEAKQAQMALAMIVDPYGGSGKSKMASSTIELADPYAKTPTSKIAGDKYEELLEKGLDKSTEAIGARRKAVEQLLMNARPGSRDAVAMQRFIANAKTTEQFGNALGALFKGAQYGQSIKAIVDAKIPEERESARTELKQQIATDLVEGGLPRVAKWLWSDEASKAMARVFEGGWYNAATILLDSVETGHPWLDLPPQKVIMDKSGTYSTEAKREAMDNYFRAYIRNGQNWSSEEFTNFVNSIEYLSRTSRAPAPPTKIRIP